MHLSLNQNFGRASRLTSVVLALVATAIVAGPVAAATPPISAYGNTVECRYKTTDTGMAKDWWLKRFVVTPPVLYANSGTQTVGWRFIVTRSNWFGTEPWETTYRSPIEKASATTTKKAPFTSKSVGVTLPVVENVKSVWYHVTLKLYRYRPDGSVRSTTTYLMPWMKGIQAGHYYGDYDDVCPAGYYEGP